MPSALASLSVAGLALTLVGCGGSTRASPSPSWAPTSTLTLAGSPSITGPVSVSQVVCAVPDLAGAIIQADLTSGSTVMSLTVTSTAVRVSAGPGATYSGTGVKRFDANGGAELDARALRPEAAIPGVTPQTGGVAVTAMRGTVVCGKQPPSMGRLTVSGKTPDGSLAGALGHLKVVDCTPIITEAKGTTSIGGHPYLASLTVINGVGGHGRSIEFELSTNEPVPGERLYTASDPSPVPEGKLFHLDVNLHELPSDGSADNSNASGAIHLAGDISCP
ncbi:MAG TPA: hypothetical protein VE219_03750 [Candidatus Sulfotelmatobacter sp.]|nr:hypothetical protein [Candidatus Sulfotelmatobacter sp.]